MKKSVLTTLVIALVLLGTSLYLYSVNHPEKTVITIPSPYTYTVSINTTTLTAPIGVPFEGPIIATTFIHTNYTPPPYYASLWLETLAVGIVLLLISILLLRRKF
ncbi:hypothetical protein SULI_07690 [Saccharolobus solfataricus]|uniref:Uncharacterized protein n=3 Tax=Saccharolobus solfataricus TaxID=2287 RepID=Q7LXX1_SACS2|nr:hypothetical protein [Saccharolobus solfataricus]AAK40838.1 Hypothetical protein SSO0520 [Saccharolobus solfataricus P2]AKA73807.1 hypothetical protein SULB_1542 [Saccharolobus solfataricus]AKA76504.1 hypothetical protein SULC_1540 [Saccharolobus solfataricus]AKA79197.1 hypothetical protein SULA_1541 [Saccharolobus solfataricus]AZF68283.1 hypothetical protein SULG_07690 [Saccharolobus solfataricus]